ncbi:Fatty acyl-CoA elongase/Polyunsaturated fatty acid specific elongation enzyme [Cryptotrichosporon argae]
MSSWNPLAAWQPGPGPVYTLLTSFWQTTGLPNPPSYLVNWEKGVSPLSTQKAVVAAIGTYLLVIFGGRELMRPFKPFKLTFLFQVHNVILTVGSAILLALILEDVVPLVLRHGFYWAICSPAAFQPRLVTFYMINYYIKYVELLDTVFLVLKKKPLAFLHYFHHAATAVLCFSQIEGTTAVQWVVISLNLLVHVIMYYYYYATAGGARIWWKKYLTTMQITQFIIDLFIVYFATWNHFAFKWNKLYSIGVPHVADCTGSEPAALFGCGLLTSYLVLFIAFYKATYKKSAKRAAGKAAKDAGLESVAQDVRGSKNSK